ncbi:MAG: pyridoxal-phosphate dependent enzyme [Actinophytocola sp.]|nr:pyridoxal-phosphate dependent enzyme [Actinophytocola sp.]
MLDGVTRVEIDHIRDAAKRIAAVALRTPLLEQPWSQRPLWLKPENLQAIGAFKIRGAYNAIAVLDDAQRANGVVAYSSGNHANAVAFAAKAFGVPALIVMQDSTPRVKVEATAAHGAEIIEVPMADRERVATEIATQRGMALIPPFDHPDVIAGQGTIGLEIVEDLPDVDVVLVPVAGGGLASGVGVAVKALRPEARVIAVEPALAADTAEGLRAGHRVHWSPERRARTIADGLRTEPSELTFAHLRDVVDNAVTVTEDEIRATMRTLATRARLVAEPSGAVACAAALYRELPPGRTVAVVSGGNVDPALLAEVLS